MAVVEKTQTQEQKQAEEQQSEKMGSDLAKNIIKTLDLPTSISDAVNGEATKQGLGNEEEVSEQETSEEPTENVEAAEESEPVKEEREDKEDKTDSVQKRIDELTREKKLLEARLKKLESKSEPDMDPDLKKLQEMSVDELRELRKKVIKFQRIEADEAKLDQLFDLEEKVNKTIESAPLRFQAQQVERFEEAVREASDLSQKELEVVFGHAKNIFARTPSFQKSVDGQAEAWNLAVEHYREMNKLTVGKSKVNELERKVNDLKKKTSLDTAVQKGTAKVSEETRLWNKAKSGGTQDKEAYLRKRLNTDQFIPEEFRR